MRVLAARFSASSEAKAALDLLQRELDPTDMAVAPLASPDEPAAADTVLAGQFRDDQATAAVELVEQAGGEIVADVDVRWTGMNMAPPTTTRAFRFD